MLSIQRTVYPFSYNKNADRHTHEFTANFNYWTAYIKAMTGTDGDRLLNEAKELLTVSK